MASGGEPIHGYAKPVREPVSPKSPETLRRALGEALARAEEAEAREAETERNNQTMRQILEHTSHNQAKKDTELHQLKLDAEAAAAAKQRAESRAEQLDRELGELQRASGDDSTRSAALQSSLDRMKQQVRTLESELETQRAAHLAESQATSETIATQEHKLRLVKQELASTTQARLAEQAALDQLESLQAELAKSRADTQAQESGSASLNQQYERSQEALAASSAQLRESEAEVKRVRSELLAVQGVLDAATRRLEGHALLESQNSKLNAELEQLGAEYKSSIKDAVRLEQKVAHLENALARQTQAQQQSPAAASPATDCASPASFASPDSIPSAAVSPRASTSPRAAAKLQDPAASDLPIHGWTKQSTDKAVSPRAAADSRAVLESPRAAAASPTATESPRAAAASPTDTESPRAAAGRPTATESPRAAAGRTPKEEPQRARIPDRVERAVNTVINKSSAAELQNASALELKTEVEKALGRKMSKEEYAYLKEQKKGKGILSPTQSSYSSYADDVSKQFSKSGQ